MLTFIIRKHFNCFNKILKRKKNILVKRKLPYVAKTTQREGISNRMVSILIYLETVKQAKIKVKILQKFYSDSKKNFKIN